MKRLDLIRHLESHGCTFHREGAKHSVYINRANRKSSTVPRHREINEFLGPQDLQGSRRSRDLDAQPGGRGDAPASGFYLAVFQAARVSTGTLGFCPE